VRRTAAQRCAPGGLRRSPRIEARARGFTLLELALVMALIALIAALVLPRLAALRGAALDASARQLAARVRYLREEAALRGQWIRLAVDARRGLVQTAVLVETQSGDAEFEPDPNPLFRTIALPDAIEPELVGPGVQATSDGLPSTLFAPDGFAEPAVLHLDDGRGRALSIAIDPALPAPRILEGRVDATALVKR
jgi:prepilin-type N-terminal cleavage/methylation domain-containing protein